MFFFFRACIRGRVRLVQLWGWVAGAGQAGLEPAAALLFQGWATGLVVGSAVAWADSAVVVAAERVAKAFSPAAGHRGVLLALWACVADEHFVNWINGCWPDNKSLRIAA